MIKRALISVSDKTGIVEMAVNFKAWELILFPPVVLQRH